MERGRTIIGAMLAVVLLVHLITLYIPGSPEAGSLPWPHADKVVHVVAFAVPAFLLRQVSDTWWPVALLALHAPVSELVQHHFVPFRSGDVGDAVADLAGVAAGLVAARLVGGRRRPQSSTTSETSSNGPPRPSNHRR